MPRIRGGHHRRCLKCLSSANWWHLGVLRPERLSLCPGMLLASGVGDTDAGLRHATMLLQAEKIKKAFGVTSQQAACEASDHAPVPPGVVPTSQHEAMSDLLQQVLKL